MKELYKIGKSDLIKGFILSFITAVLTALVTALNNNSFPITWDEYRIIIFAALTSGISYILKNFLTNSEGKFLKEETK